MKIFTEQEAFQRSLTVYPEVLRKKSREVLARLREMKNAFEILERAVDRTRGYWLGEAGTFGRAYMVNRNPEVEEMLLRLMEHVQELEHMAAVYAKAELEAEEAANELPTDVIV